MNTHRFVRTVTMFSLLCGSFTLQAAPGPTRLYDHERAELVPGGAFQPGRLQHTLSLVKPAQVQNGIRHAEYNLASGSGRKFVAVHHREEGRDGSTGLIEARDVQSGKTVKWQIHPDRFQQVCHDGSTITATGDDAGHYLHLLHSSGQGVTMAYAETKSPQERHQLEVAGSLIVHHWCPIDHEQRAALAAAHRAGIVDMGDSAKSFGSFFHAVSNFFSNIGQKVCSGSAGAKAQICMGSGALVGGAVGFPVALKTSLGTGAKVGTAVTVSLAAACGTAIGAGCR